MWDWWDDTVEAVGGLVDDGVAWVNDVVDTYVWDTTTNEASLEAAVRDTFDIPDLESKGFIGEAWKKINEVVDTYLWDTTTDEADLERWVRDNFDIPDQESEGFIDEVFDGIAESWGEDVDTVKDAFRKASDTVSGGVKDVAGQVCGIIDNISLVLGIGFDAAMAALSTIPSLFTLFIDTLTKLFTIDETTVVEDTLKLGKLQKELGERLEELGT